MAGPLLSLLPSSALAAGFTGFVTKEDGVTPLSAVTVSAVNPLDDSIVQTAATAGDGSYSMTLAPGTYHLQADPAGYFPSIRSSHTVVSGDVAVNFALQSTGLEAMRDNFSVNSWSVRFNFANSYTLSPSGSNVLVAGMSHPTTGSNYLAIERPAVANLATYPYITVRNKFVLKSGTLNSVYIALDADAGWTKNLGITDNNTQSWPWRDRTYAMSFGPTGNIVFVIGDPIATPGTADMLFDHMIMHSADRGYVAGQVKTPAGTPLPDTRVQLRKGAAVIGEALSDSAGNYVIWAATSTGGYTVYSSTSNGAQFSQASVSVGGRVQTTVNVTLDPSPPAQVQGARFTATSQTGVHTAWNPYGGGGYWVAISSDPAFAVWQASQAVGAGVTTLSMSGLSANTTYYLKVKGEAFTDAYYSAAASSATPPAVPQNFAFSSVWVTSAALQWAAGGNPPGTWYQAEVAIDEGFITAVGLSSAAAAAAEFGSLNPNTTYYFSLKALGHGGQDAAYAAVLSTITLTRPPVSEAYALVSSTGLSVFWDNNGNPAGTRYELEESTSAFSTVNYSSVTDSNYFEASSLIPNTTYYYRAAAVNGAGVRSAVTDFAPVATYSAPPLPNPPSLGAVTGTSVETRWLINSNPISTEYYVWVSTDQAFNGLDFGPGAWFAAPAYNVLGLESGRAYYFRVRSRDFLGRYSAWLDLGTKTTTAGVDNTPPSVSDIQGGDDSWRGAGSGSYSVHFSDLGSGLDRFEVKVTSGPYAGGIVVADWTPAVTSINDAYFEQDWTLPAAAFDAIQENVTSYVSVRVYDQAANVTTYPNAFYVLRDTTPPTINDYADYNGGWLAADPGAIFDVDFADALSGLSQVLYSASNQPGLADANVMPWTAVAGFSAAPSFGALWGVDFGALADGASNYISVRAVDAAGNVATRQDVFRILKNTVGPAVSVAAPQPGYVSTAAVLSGAASPMNEYSPVTGNEVAIQELTGNNYFDGSAFASAGAVWLNASGLAAWSYAASTVPFAAGTQYKVYARSRDNNGFLTPLPYPSVTFQLDQAAPTVWVSTPAQASSVYAFDAVEGTAADTGGSGLAGAEVYLMRLSDGKWWNFQTAAWGGVPVASAPAAGSPWTFTPDGALRAALVHGQQYYAGAAARDSASPANASPFGSAGSTFTWVDTYAPDAVTAFAPSTGTSPGRINLAWTFPGDDGGGFALTHGRYAVQYSTFPEAVFSTQAAQVMISTGLVQPGAQQVHTIAGLSPETTYYLTLWTEDDAGLWSGPSPLASTLSGESLNDMISGSVRNPSGAGITGVMVEAITNTGMVAAAGYTLDDGLGSFTLNGLADGLYRVQATWLENGFASSVAKDQIPMGYADANFLLSVTYELASVSGSVPSSAPSAAPAARTSGARPAPAAVQLWQGSRMLAAASPDAAGRFSIRNLIPGRYELRAAGSDGAWRSFPISLASGENLQLSPLGTLLLRSSVYAYPNPADGGYVKFRLQTDVSPVRASLAVYALDGRLVKAAEYGGPGWTYTAGSPDTYEYRWDFGGGSPASGVYFYTLRLKQTSSGETDGFKGKFAVIR